MKKRYKLRIPASSRNDFHEMLSKLNALNDAAIPANDHVSKEVDYIVSLSKYDLLYLRLSCDPGIFKSVRD